MPDDQPTPEGQPTISQRTQADLDKAIREIFRLGVHGTQYEWPTRQFQLALMRDGDHGVIEYMSAIAARAIHALAQATGESPAEVTRQMHDQFDRPYLPFSQVAWTRARVLSLYRLDGRPIQVSGGEIAAVDLVGGLALLHVLAVVRLAGVRRGRGESSATGHGAR